jgi:hypothetical protein
MLYRKRYYSTEFGRFASRDPVKYEGGDANLVRYVGNQCIDYVDPYGLARDSVSTAIARAIATGDIETLKVLLASGGLNEQQIQAILIAIASIELATRIKKCKKPKCQPCIPPAGTRSVRVDIVPPSRPHWPYSGTHTHHYEMQQSPFPMCRCFWREISVTGGNSPDIGEGPIKPASGGGAE